MIFFNTHGSDKSILLMEGSLPAYKLVQRVQLASRPIVFNNSCLSWIGVGGEFVRTGARAYIGTLWSVDAVEAAKYAQAVLDKMVGEGAPVAHTMRSTGIESSTERAYILIGTCNAVFDRAPAKIEAESQRAAAAIQYVISAAMTLCNQNGGDSDQIFITRLEDHLFTEAESMYAEYERRWPQPSLDHFDILVARIKLLAEMVVRQRATVNARLAIVDQAGKILDAINIDEKTRWGGRAHWLQIAARLSLRLGQSQRALAQLDESIKAATEAAISPGPQYLELSDTHKALGHLEESLEAAHKARQSYAADPKTNDAKQGEMYAIGRLASIYNWLNRRNEAIDCAKQGFAIAQCLNNIGEQAEFKADEARALLGLQRFDAALQEAGEAIRLARRSRSDGRELAAHGISVQALIGKGELTSALERAQLGLRQARARDFLSEEGDFLMDIAMIDERSGKLADAFESARLAVTIFVQIGRLPKVRNTLGFLTELHRN
jgi:tetratricopeptide (TPR) repeat protein